MMRLILSFFTAVFIFSSVSGAEETEKKAFIAYLKGDIKIVKKGSELPLNAKLGMSITAGDKIITGADSKTELKFEDGANLRIGDNSTLVLEELKQKDGTDRSTIKVMFGRVWMNIKKTLDSNPRESSLVTAKVIAAVKGTTYRADVDRDGEAVVTVYDGKVAISKEGKDEEAGKLEKVVSKTFVKAKFDEAEDAKDEWVRWNKNRDKLRVMIVFTERKNKELAVVPISEVVFAEEMLKNYIYTVIDQAELQNIRTSEKLIAAVKGDAAAAAAAGLEIGADLIITGQVDTDVTRPEMIAGWYSGVADITVKAVRCDTAVVLAAKNTQAKAPEITEQAAMTNAIRKASTTLLEQINDRIIKSWKIETSKGSSLDIVLTGVSFENTEAIRQALSSISGVKNVNQISLVAKRALLTLNFSGDSLSLVQKIGELKVKNITLNVVGLSMSKIEIEVK